MFYLHFALLLNFPSAFNTYEALRSASRLLRLLNLPEFRFRIPSAFQHLAGSSFGISCVPLPEFCLLFASRFLLLFNTYKTLPSASRVFRFLNFAA
jgi:hypothetical protein